jgi:hypothetical protein
MKEKMRNSVKVIFDNSKYNYETSVSDQTTKQSAKTYFVGTSFDMGVFPNEDLQVCTKIEFSSEDSI